MGADIVVIFNVLGEKPLQMPLVQRDDVVEQVSPDDAD